MVSTEPANVPEPSVDEEPDPGSAAGGVDALDHDQETDLPPLTADVPVSAQVEDKIPAEVQEPEDPDTEANVEDPSAEPSG